MATNLFRNRFGGLIRDLMFLVVSALLLWLGAKYWIGFNPVLGGAEPPDSAMLRERLKNRQRFRTESLCKRSAGRTDIARGRFRP